MDINEALRIRGVGVGKKLKGDAQPSDVRVGKTFSNALSNEHTGAIPVRSLVAQTITPTTNNIVKQAGIYDGDLTIQGDPNLAAQNIKQGVTLFGVAGTLTGTRFASGAIANNPSSANFNHLDGTSVAQTNVTVTGLAFKPSFIYLVYVTSANVFTTTYSEGVGPTTPASYSKVVRISRYQLATFADTSRQLQGDTGAASVTNGSFTLPVGSTGTFSWVAFE